MPGVPGGEHYDVGGIAVIDFNRAKLTPEEFRGACIFNINKYMNRKKGTDLDDYKKARNYLNWLIEACEEARTEERRSDSLETTGVSTL